jgi:hypothetical protein
MSQTKHDTDFCFTEFFSEHKFQSPATIQDTKEYDPDEQKDRAYQPMQNSDHQVELLDPMIRSWDIEIINP